MFVPTLVCVALAASSAVPALGRYAGYRRADLDDDFMFACESYPSLAPLSCSQTSTGNIVERRDESSGHTKSRPKPGRPKPEGVLPHAIMRSDEGSTALWEREYDEMERRDESSSRPKGRPRPRPRPDGVPPHAIMRRSCEYWLAHHVSELPLTIPSLLEDSPIWPRAPKDGDKAPKYNQDYRSDLHHPQPIHPNPKWVGHHRVTREDVAGLWEREYDDELWARMEVDELD